MPEQQAPRHHQTKNKGALRCASPPEQRLEVWEGSESDIETEEDHIIVKTLSKAIVEAIHSLPSNNNKPNF